MWNESATRARECTAYPVMSSMRKKTESMAKRILILVDFESPMLSSTRCLDKTREWCGPNVGVGDLYDGKLLSADCSSQGTLAEEQNPVNNNAKNLQSNFTRWSLYLAISHKLPSLVKGIIPTPTYNFACGEFSNYVNPPEFGWLVPNVAQ